MTHRIDRLMNSYVTNPYLASNLQGQVLAESHGSYELCHEIAAGDVARVYLAVHKGSDGLRRRLALKYIHPHLTRHPNFGKMFYDEAQIAALVDHACVCRTYDFGHTAQGYFLAMEYLVGEPLSRVISALHRCPHADIRQRTPLLAARIIANVCEALHAGHEVRDPRGERIEVVHRNITPKNIFVLYDGTVRVLDFGVARCHEQMRKTSPGIHDARLAYSAPEQARGERVDRRADIWSAGVVLHELITQRPLLAEADQTTAMSLSLSRPVAAPSGYASHVPAALDAVVATMLCPDLGGRYGTAREVATQLEAVLSMQRDTVPAADLADIMAVLFRSAELPAVNQAG